MGSFASSIGSLLDPYLYVSDAQVDMAITDSGLPVGSLVQLTLHGQLKSHVDDDAASESEIRHSYLDSLDEVIRILEGLGVQFGTHPVVKIGGHRFITPQAEVEMILIFG